MKVRRALIVGVAVGAMAAVQVAKAQPAANSGAATDQAAASGQEATSAMPTEEVARLDEIVVSAQRRDENLQRAAIAISAVSGDALIEAGVSRPTELTAVAPGRDLRKFARPFLHSRRWQLHWQLASEPRGSLQCRWCIYRPRFVDHRLLL